MGILSLRRTPMSGAEWAVVIAWAAWTALLMKSSINIGFRHYLPAYIFLMILASRCLVAPGRFGSAIAWAGILAAGLHGAWQHPDYLSYINAPWPHPYLAISDSNIDWGQCTKQVGRWLDKNPQPGRKIFLANFGYDRGGIKHYLQGRVTVLRKDELPEPRSVLIISPVQLVGAYGDDRFEALRAVEPDHIIGHSMLVYYLDRFGDQLPFQAPRPGDGGVL
jgi:hypothetical protein